MSRSELLVSFENISPISTMNPNEECNLRGGGYSKLLTYIFQYFKNIPNVVSYILLLQNIVEEVSDLVKKREIIIYR